MAYPSTIDSFSTKSTGDVIQPAHVNDLQTAVVALETKAGITGSAVTTSLDYKLTNASSVSPGHKHVTADLTDAGTFVGPGFSMNYNGLTLPTGYLVKDSSAISRTVNAPLFSAIGTAFGVGDGATTFNLPGQSLPTELALLNSAHFVSASSQYLSKASPANLSITSDISMTAWIYAATLPGNGTTRAILGRVGGSGNRGWRFELDNNSGTYTLEVILSSDGTAGATLNSTAFTPVASVWYHVAVSYVALTGIASFYLNGLPLGTASGGPSSLFATTAPFTIGAIDTGGSPSEFWNGNIANAKVFNSALTQNNVIVSSTYYNTPTIKGSWTLNNALTDSSGNGNTLNNNAVTTFSVVNPLLPDIGRVGLIKT